MFLHNLKSKQKQLFVELAIKAAEANGVVELTEKNMLKAYSMEMEIAPAYSSDSNIDTLLQEMRDISNESELRIVLFELLGILVSDEEYDQTEKVFFEKVRNAFGISKDRCDEMLTLLNEYSSVYQKIVSAVL